jgi:hypothetical protein
MEIIFKKGDRVFHYHYGWGSVEVTGEPIVEKLSVSVNFANKNRIWFTFDGREYYYERPSLSFTEYRLEGFSQDRPEELPNKGDIVWVRQEFPSEWRVGHFFKKEGDKYYVSCSPNVVGWTAEGIELRTNNPYENEQ